MKNDNRISRTVGRLLAHPMAGLAVVITFIGASATVVHAVCNQSNASDSDKNLWDTHGCWTDFFQWSQNVYNMDEGNWHDRGWHDACNRNLEFPKHWNSTYLVTYGLTDNVVKQFHGTVDYRASAEGKPGNNYHTEFEHSIFDELDDFGRHRPGFLLVDEEVETGCLLYNGGVPEAWANGNPASRAGDFMHESWHSWMDKWDYDNGDHGGHRPSSGACHIDACDNFYWHPIGAFNFGEMWQSDGAKRFHSPNQVQVEFLCDISDLAQDWVPSSVRGAAAVDANQRATERFINGPGYSCGDPRPF